MTDHHHSHDHAHSSHGASEQTNRPQYDDINTGTIILVGLISAIVTFLIIGFVQGLAYRWQAHFEQQRIEAVNQRVKAEVEAQRSILANVPTKDGQSIPGRISIEEAKKQVLEKFKQSSEAPKTSNSTESSNPPSQVASGQ
jgi:uncharacterized membrane protein